MSINPQVRSICLLNLAVLDFLVCREYNFHLEDLSDAWVKEMEKGTNALKK